MRRENLLTHRRPILALLLGGALITIGAWRAACRHEGRLAAERYATLVEHAANSLFLGLEREAAAELAAIPAMISFYDCSERVEPEEFDRYAASMMSRYPGLVALMWAPAVTPGPADALPAATSYPVQYVALRAGQAAAAGMDLASRPDLQAVVDAAVADTRLQVRVLPALDPRFGDDKQLVAVAPVLGRADRRVPQGVVLGVYDIPRLVEAALTIDGGPGGSAHDFDLLIYPADGDRDRAPLYRHAAAGAQPTPPIPLSAVQSELHVVHPLQSIGTPLLAVARPRVQQPPAPPRLFSWTVLVAGLALTGTLAGIFRTFALRNRVIERLVEQRTAELAQANKEIAQRERHLQSIVDATLDGIITIDESGRILSVNPATERIFGYSADELVGQPLTRLVPDRAAAQHEQGLAARLQDPEAGFVGSTIEVQGRRRDGTVFDAELSVSELVGEGPRRFLGVIRDISPRKEVDQLKDRFISTVSHELRTPLTAILGSLELLRDGAFGPLPEGAAHMVSLAYDSGERLVRLINDILDLERLGTGRMDLYKTDIDAGDLLSHVAATLQGFASRHEVRLEISPPSSTLQVHADRDRLVQVLTNLVGNAVRFSPPGGTVRLGVQPAAGVARFRVEDEGPGIPDEFKDRLFAPFSQADAGDTRRQGGTGLGLSIAKAIVQEHGGQIWYASQQGRGTTFFFDIPVQPVDRPGVRP